MSAGAPFPGGSAAAAELPGAAAVTAGATAAAPAGSAPAGSPPAGSPPAGSPPAASAPAGPAARGREASAEDLPARPGSLAELFRFRQLIQLLVVRELKVRYKRSVFGLLWTMLNPLLLMVVYTVVFTTIFPTPQRNFSIFLLAALLPWLFFANSLMQGLMSVLSNQELIRKVRLPQAVFPLSVVGSNLVNFTLSLAPLFLLMGVLGQPFTTALLFLPVSAVILTVFLGGATLLFATATVFFRDVRHLTEVLLQMLLYISPVFYEPHQIAQGEAWWSGAFRTWLQINPMTALLPLVREPVYYGRVPSAAAIGTAVLWAAGTAFVGWRVFKRLSPRHIHYL